MQDGELKNRLQAMWMPKVDAGAESAALQRSIAAFQKPATHDVPVDEALPPAPWALRDWLWPSPYAWMAIAALWVILLMGGGSTRAPENQWSLSNSAKVEWSDSVRFTASADYPEILKQIRQPKPSP